MLAATGCDTSEGSAPAGPTPLVWSPWQSVVIVGRLIDFKTGSPAPDRRFTLGGHQLTTNEHGRYSIVMPVGDHPFDVEGENVDSYILARGFATNGDIYVNGGDCASRYGIIRDRVTGRPVAGASVTHSGGAETSVSDSNGWYKHDRLGACGEVSGNTIFLNIKAAGYRDGVGGVGRGFNGVGRRDIELDPK